jgi:hypothetical protein
MRAIPAFRGYDTIFLQDLQGESLDDLYTTIHFRDHRFF